MVRAKARPTIGFGFDPAQSPHHFLVVQARGTDNVQFEERFSWEEHADPDMAAPEPSLKATLDGYRWSRVATTVAETLNARLRQAGLKTGEWGTETPLAPHLGKEVTLLTWAVEDADPTLIPTMLANWVGLAPEERWWLYSTINATSGHPEHGRDRGWRKAIKIAFAENPVNVPPSALLGAMPDAAAKAGARKRGKHSLPSPEAEQMPLF